jgi:aspartokinase
VVHPRALLTGWTGRTPIVVRSTFSDAPGTFVGDVEDERELVGLAALPPMDTVALAAGSISQATRGAWERSRQVMTLVDDRTGEIIAGASADHATECHEAFREAAVEPVRSIGRCCWLSVVGEPDALRAHHEGWVARLGKAGVTLHAHELAARRCTYVMPDPARQVAARTVHETFDRRTPVAP